MTEIFICKDRRLRGETITNSSRRKKKTSVTTKPLLQVVKAILRDLLAEYDTNEVKRMWQMIRQEP